MLIAITLVLMSEKAALLPQYVGRANYAATLTRLNQMDPSLGAYVHEGDGPKPITCSSLLNAPANRQGTPIQAGKPYFVRVTGLDERTSQGLSAGLLETPPASWELDGHGFQVAEVICDEARDAWSGRATYETLAARQLTRSDQPPRKATLHFASPTSFKSQGMTVPVPMPGLVFGSLVERWNAFSPVTLSPEMRRFGQEMVAISRYKLQSRPVVQKNGALRMGGMGEVTYVALGGDRYWRSVMQMLADFAKYSGVGVQTATGMGQTRRKT
jgi:CRISPR-associated endoribonuclease Cas6